METNLSSWTSARPPKLPLAAFFHTFTWKLNTSTSLAKANVSLDCATVDLLLSNFAEDVIFVRWVHEQEVRFFFFSLPPRVQSGREATVYAASSGAQRDPTCAFQEMRSICWSALAARGRFCAPSMKSRLWIPSGASASVRLAKCWFLPASVTHFWRVEYSISGVHTSR